MAASSPVFFATATAFRRWLAKNAATQRELLVGFWKVDSGQPSMSWPESVDEALCFGWIDGVRKRIDAGRYQIRFTPRKPDSIWSAVNIAKFEKLAAEGRMTDAGRAAFELRTAARSMVYAYEQAQVQELTGSENRAFADQPAAQAYFEGCPPGYRKTLLHWVTSAKRPDTRALRLQKLIAACAAGQRLR